MELPSNSLSAALPVTLPFWQVIRITSEKIDVARAEAAYKRADEMLKKTNASETDLKLAEAKLRRALVRKSAASLK